MAVAAMIATIEMIEKGKLLENAQRFETQIRQEFQALPQVREIRGSGCLLGLVMDRPAKDIQRALFSEGIIVGLNANPNLVHLLPPLIVNAAETHVLLEKLRKVLG